MEKVNTPEQQMQEGDMKILVKRCPECKGFNGAFFFEFGGQTSDIKPVFGCFETRELAGEHASKEAMAHIEAVFPGRVKKIISEKDGLIKGDFDA